MGVAGSAIDRRLRVVVLDHTAAPSGAELALLSVLEHLDVDRHVVLGASGPLRQRLADAAGLEVAWMPPRLGVASRAGGTLLAGPQLLQHAASLAVRLRGLRPDVVYANSLRSGSYGGLAALLAGVPLVWHVRDRVTADYLGRRRAQILRVLIRVLSTHVVANSRTTAATLLPGSPVTVVPSPLSSPPRPREERPAGPLVYVAASRLSPWKGQDVFLRAFAAAFPDGEQRAVVLGGPHFGETAYADGLRTLVEELGLQDRVVLRGHRDDVMDELAGADVLVHTPTLPEPFGRVVVEGLAAGLVVVARGDGGPAETLTDGVDGLLYPPDRPDELVRLLRLVDGDPALRRRLTDAGRALGLEFSPERVAAEVLAVCQDAARRGGRGSGSVARLRRARARLRPGTGPGALPGPPPSGPASR